jgi:hypothetical protein
MGKVAGDLDRDGLRGDAPGSVGRGDNETSPAADQRREDDVRVSYTAAGSEIVEDLLRADALRAQLGADPF